MKNFYSVLLTFAVAMFGFIGTMNAGTGTQDDPYTCAELLTNQSKIDVWVVGYIVAPLNTTYGLLLSDDLTENNAIGVKLSSDDLKKLNPTTTPANLNKKVKLKGNAGSYCGKPGLKTTSEYEWFVDATATPYTVTLDNQGTTSTLTETAAGAGIELQTPTIASEDWTFAGWSETAVTETTTAPTLIQAGTYRPTENITLYAVYSKSELGGVYSGNGTETAPYTVEQVIALNNPNTEDQWVVGYIIGTRDNAQINDLSETISNFILSVDDVKATTFDSDKHITVDYNTVEDKIEKDYANMFGKIIKVRGDLIAYFGNPGVKNCNSYEWLEEMPAAVSVTYNSNPVFVASAVVRPEITVTGDPQTDASVSVALACATEGATIYYTIDGTEPTAESTEYTDPISVSATTTIKVIAKNGEDLSSVAEETITFPTIVDIATFITNADEDNVSTLGAVTVTYQSSDKKTVFIQDATGYLQFYNNSGNPELTNGSVLTGLQGKYSEYQNISQIKTTSIPTPTVGTAVEPIEKTIAEINSDLYNYYVVIKDVEVVSGITIASDKQDNVIVKDTEGTELTCRTQYKDVAVDVAAGDKVDVIGFVSAYSNKIQLNIISISESITTSIEETEVGKVFSTLGAINITGIEMANVTIYDIAGRVVAAQVVENNACITVANGIYIVRVNNTVTEVMVR